MQLGERAKSQNKTKKQQFNRRGERKRGNKGSGGRDGRVERQKEKEQTC